MKIFTRKNVLAGSIVIGLGVAFSMAAPKIRKTVSDVSGSTGIAVAVAAPQPVPTGDVVGQLTVGYQGWFATPDDGSALGKRVGFWHQSGDPKNEFVDMWPATDEYTKLSQTKYSNRPDGKPSKLFSSYHYETVDTHFRWMKEYGIYTAALQRFASEIEPGSDVKAFRDKVTQNVQRASETHGRKFYLMYDLSGNIYGDSIAPIKADWDDTLVGTLKVTDSPAYAREGTRPMAPAKASVSMRSRRPALTFSPHKSPSSALIHAAQ